MSDTETSLDKVPCKICGKLLRQITKLHLRVHGVSYKEYITKYGVDGLISESLRASRARTFLGKKHTPEALAKMSARFKGIPLSQEHRDKLSESHKGIRISETTKEKLRNCERTQEFRDKIAAYRTGKKLSPESLAKCSEAAVKRCQRNPHNYKRYYYEDLCLRSSWELDIARLLDNAGIEYDYEKRYFKYCKDGVMRNYLPDFYLKDISTYLEIKPKCFVDETLQVKLNAVKSAGYDIVLLTEDTIQEFMRDKLCIGNKP